MIADAQALTDNIENPEKIRENIIEVALDNLKIIINDKQLKDKTETASPETKIKLAK